MKHDGIPPRGVWDEIDNLVEACDKHGVPRIGACLRAYEQERLRLHTAIGNLESQLMAIVNQQRTLIDNHNRLLQILKDSGIDPEVLIKTDDIFREIPGAIQGLDASGIILPDASGIILPHRTSGGI